MWNMFDIGQEKKNNIWIMGLVNNIERREKKYLKDNETLYIYNYIAIIAGL